MGKKKNTPLKIVLPKEVEDERIKLAERLNLATHAAQLGIWDWDIQRNELVWDDRMYTLYGLKPGEFGGAYEAWLNGVHPDDRASSNEESQQAVRGEKEYDTEFRVLWPDGSIHWLKANGQVFRDEKGNPLRMVGVNYDITKHKQAVKQIEKQNGRLSTLRKIDQAILSADSLENIVSVALDHIRELVDCRRANLTLIDRKTNELVIFEVSTVGETSIPAGRRLPLAQFEDIIQTLSKNQPIVFSDYRTIENPRPGIQSLLQDGILSTCSLPLFVQGSLIGMFSMHSEIPNFFNEEEIALGSEAANQVAIAIVQIRLTDALAKNEERLRLSLHASRQGLYDLNIQTGETIINREYAELLGYDPESFIETNAAWMDRLHPDDRAITTKAYTDYINGLVPEYRVEFRQKTKQGDWKWILSLGSIVEYDAEGKPLRLMGTHTDINERKQAEEALRERESKLSTLLGLLPVGVSILDQNRNVTYANDALGKILETTQEGLSRGAYRNRKYLRADGSERPAEEFASARVFTEKIEVHDIITGIVKEDAQTVWTSVSAVPVDFPDWKVVLVTSDITERKWMEDTLRQSEEKYAALFRKAAVPAALTKMPEGVFADVNEAFQTVFGYLREEVIGKNSIEIGMAHPKERAETFIELEQYGQLIGNEKHLFTKTGEPRIGVININKVKIDGQDYVITTIHDVTERKRAEQALQQRTEELEQLLEMLPSAIWIAEDSECQVIRGNRYANELLGTSSNDNVSQSSEFATVRLRQFSKGRELAPDELPMQVAARTGQPQVDFELRIERPDQTTRVLIGGAVPLFDSSQKTRGAVAAFFDITDLKTTEEELRRSNAELEQFAYIASHDLQEPLRTLAGMVQLLRKRYQGQLDDRADEYIAHAVESADRMQSLIKDLLAYSRVDRRNQPIEAVSAQDCLQISLKNLDASIRESHATVMAEDLPIVHADATQLTQLFQNLIGNSIKFRGEREPRIQVTATRQNDAWQFAVSDNGIGIEAQYFERIFLVFQRLHTRRQYQGTGIGLALCKKIVERHGGSIWVESRPDEGSTFYFTLPIRSTS
jgi:PAS domain S-box-containing protein